MEALIVGPAPKRSPLLRRALLIALAGLLAGLVGVRLTVLTLVKAEDDMMAPGVLPGDVLLAFPQRAPKVGDVVLVESGGRAVLRRVLGVPGDRVASVNGVLAWGERPADTQVEGPFAYRFGEEVRHHQLLSERLPDGRKHLILGDYLGALYPWVLELPELTVPPGALYVLCDNRRVCPKDELSGVIPAGWVGGVAESLLWYGEAREVAPKERPLLGAFVPLSSRP